jgi:flagellar protein FlaG
MEVRGIGQAVQTGFDTNINVEKSVQGNVRTTDKINMDDNNNINGGDISEQKIKDAVEKLNKFLDDSHTHAEYEFHEKLKNDLMIKIVDSDSGEVIQEVPPKKILDMVAKMMEMVGLLVDKKA